MCLGLKLLVSFTTFLPSLIAVDSDLILAPNLTSGSHVGIVLITGAEIPNTAYTSLLQAMQETAAAKNVSLFAGAPWYWFSTPQPVDLSFRIDAVTHSFKAKGMHPDAPIFYAGHSLGTVFLQDFTLGRKKSVAGQILMGGYILRKYYYPNFSYEVPTVTIGAELDGQARISRIAENYYQTRGKTDFPVVILEGQSHMQFASGEPPSTVKKNDLQPEVDEVTAHKNIAAVAVDFMLARVGFSDAGDVLKTKVKATSDLIAPLIKAYEYEGSRRFNAPSQIGGPGEKTCMRGGCSNQSEWAKNAQKLISADIPGHTLNISNEYVDLGGSPATGQDFHLPVISNNSGSSTISITTYSGCYWNDLINEEFEDLDTALTFTSAQEIGTKLASRQCSLITGAGIDANFSVDDPDFCAQANQKAYDWALANAPAHTAERYQKYGQKMVMGKTRAAQGGPLFLYSRLQFNVGKDTDKTVTVVSAEQKTEIDYWKKHFPFPRPSSIPDPGCYHYCKLLSPARVMEWMYVDGLRLRRGLAPSISSVVSEIPLEILV
eukprot:gnl/MRDRNA2_/MRDRNA2_222997_c0_seq1.p1 gnl/MRDRNA2_/MRDRNA2_222997_c0~~gnl/MRDRNA2_/MRDRNA2_222997_c0_seq1.p1  ORF type:complete len:547 (-),score=83.71 gnl/MRDRNA2_/MRDRNA2_222997_c0_seq1:14-1654(-)